MWSTGLLEWHKFLQILLKLFNSIKVHVSVWINTFFFFLGPCYSIKQGRQLIAQNEPIQCHKGLLLHNATEQKTDYAHYSRTRLSHFTGCRVDLRRQAGTIHKPRVVFPGRRLFFRRPRTLFVSDRSRGCADQLDSSKLVWATPVNTVMSLWGVKEPVMRADRLENWGKRKREDAKVREIISEDVWRWDNRHMLLQE